MASSTVADVSVETIYEGNQYLATATKADADTQVFPTDSLSIYGNPNEFYLSSLVRTTQTYGGAYELPRGNYSYTTTISCLQ